MYEFDWPRIERMEEAIPSKPVLAKAAGFAKGLADPTRLGIAVALREGSEACVMDVSNATGHTENLVSHHVRVLKAAGLATSRREGKLMVYELTPIGRCLVDAVVGPNRARRRRRRRAARRTTQPRAAPTSEAPDIAIGDVIEIAGREYEIVLDQHDRVLFEPTVTKTVDQVQPR